MLAPLTHEKIWFYFEQILSIPRASKKEDKIANYIIQFAREHNLLHKTDKAGNIVIEKKASKGFEDKPTIVLQSHLDMVCEKNSDATHNWDSDPINAYIDGNWVKAKGTTLGADDGIGIAAQLAILSSDNISHGPIECLFTVDEETGLTGAFELEPGFFNGKILLNLDSEDEGILFIGCAGGMDTEGSLQVNTIAPPNGSQFYKIAVTGLKGGHSGDEINKGLGNSIKIISRIVFELLNSQKVSLCEIIGGNLKNAIPREAFATVCFEAAFLPQATEIIHILSRQIFKELEITEPDIKIDISPVKTSLQIIETPDALRLINILLALPHGAIRMSSSIEGLVETSTNLASVKPSGDGSYIIATSQRSSVDSQKFYIAQSVASVFRLAGASIKHSTGYPGWQPNISSTIVTIANTSYKILFGVSPIVTAIHAGLECGLFLEKYPELDMVSFGPTIKGAHSPDERLDIESVDKFWKLLVEILKSI